MQEMTVSIKGIFLQHYTVVVTITKYCLHLHNGSLLYKHDFLYIIGDSVFSPSAKLYISKMSLQL